MLEILQSILRIGSLHIKCGPHVDCKYKHRPSFAFFILFESRNAALYPFWCTVNLKISDVQSVQSNFINLAAQNVNEAFV